ncbi:ABC-type oligopeptide transport system substrate-binding subunit [Bradyrhizobium sp. LM2.7]
MFMFQRLFEGPGVRLAFVFTFGLAVVLSASGAQAGEAHAIAMHGKPALPADFTHMPPTLIQTRPRAGG